MVASGNFLEMYDFQVFGFYAAAIGATFFPKADAMVMPSTFPEAFGMVAVEGASGGTLPISAGHSEVRMAGC